MSVARTALFKKAICFISAFLCVLISAAPASAAPLKATAPSNPFSLKVEQIISASADSENPTYTYRLKPYERSAPMPEGSTGDGYEFTITGNSSIYIGQFSYKNQGVYRYDLSKVTDKCKPGHMHIKRKYTIDVYVTEDLSTGVVVLNEDGTKAETLLFESSYEDLSGPAEPDKPASPPGSGSNTSNNSNNAADPDGNSYRTGDDMIILIPIILLFASGMTAFCMLIHRRKRI